jgi:hypothetical protein
MLPADPQKQCAKRVSRYHRLGQPPIRRRGALAPRSGVLTALLLLHGCAGDPPSGFAREPTPRIAPDVPSTPTPPTVSTLDGAPYADAGDDSAFPLDAPSGTAETDQDASADDELVTDRRSFRQIIVGETAVPRLRLTWLLLRDAGRVKLLMVCQKERVLPGPYLALDGRELLDRTWALATETTFVGSWKAYGSPMRLDASADGGAASCVPFARMLSVTCRPTEVRVLAAGARPKGQTYGGTSHWEPPGGQSVPALSCWMSRDPASPREGLGISEAILHVDSSWPLVFVVPQRHKPGIEWAFENSEGVRQTGAFRWMVPGPVYQ